MRWWRKPADRNSDSPEPVPGDSDVDAEVAAITARIAAFSEDTKHRLAACLAAPARENPALVLRMFSACFDLCRASNEGEDTGEEMTAAAAAAVEFTLSLDPAQVVAVMSKATAMPEAECFRMLASFLGLPAA